MAEESCDKSLDGDTSEGFHAYQGALLEFMTALDVHNDGDVEEATQLSALVRTYQLTFGSMDHTRACDSLVDALQARWQERHDKLALRACIEVQGELLGLHPSESPDRMGRCVSLILSLREYSDIGTGCNLLQEVIEQQRGALDAQPAGHPRRASPCEKLSVSLYLLFEHTEDINLLEQAISFGEEALQLRPADHSERASFCKHVAVCCRESFENTDRPEDLHKAVELMRESLRLSASDLPDRAEMCSNLAIWLEEQFEYTDDDTLRDEVVALERETRDLLPVGHPNRPSSCSVLAISLYGQFQRTGNRALLEQAIALEREALELCAVDDPYRVDVCASLAVPTQSLWEQTGDSALLDEIIRLDRDVLSLRQMDDDDRATACNNLAVSLHARFDQTGDDALLDEAITLGEKALDLRPPGHADRAISCANMAVSLTKRFDKTRDNVLLDQAIELEREVLASRPPGHGDRARTCGNLASSLLKRFDLVPSEDLLSEIITLEREASFLIPDGHIDRAWACINLASSLCRHSEMYRDAPEIAQPDVDEALGLLDEALRLRPLGHPQRWTCLSQQAELALLQHNPLAAIKKIHQAITASPFDDVDNTLFAAVKNLKQIINHPLTYSEEQELLKTYKDGLGLVTLASGLALDTLTQLQHILNGSALGSQAYMLATRVGDLPLGLELLDQARGVIWSQSLHVRDPDLARVPSELAKELRSILHGMSGKPAPGLVSERELHYSQRSQLQQVLREVRSIPGLQDFMRGPAVGALLTTAADHPVVVLIPGESECQALIVSRNKPLVNMCIPDIGRKALQDLAMVDLVPENRGALSDHDRAKDRFMKGVNSIWPPHARLKKLWRSIVQPVISHLGFKKARGQARPRIHWCPTGTFAFIPLHAAGIYEGQSQECCSDYVVSSYTPTLATLLQAQRTAQIFAPERTQILAVAVKHAPGQPTLPCVTQEIREITNVATKKGIACMSDEGLMTKAEIIESLESANIVHLACHGAQHASEPHKSQFCLGIESLTISELMNVDLKNAFLAFLSACETAKGDQKHADEVVHLAATMLFAGFKSVVATMWAMRDEDGPFVAKHFYEKLFESNNIDLDAVAYALDHAVTALRESGVSPQRWATFVHMGA